MRGKVCHNPRMAREHKTPKSKKDGNVWQNEKSGRWEWEVALTRRDGTQYRKHGSRATEKDALDSRDKAFAEFNKTEGANARGWTIKTWTEHCLAEIWPNEIAETTIDTYRHWLNSRVIPIIGGVRIDDANVPQLQKFFNKVKADTSKEVAERVQTALSSAFTRAMEQGLIVVNPCRSVKLRDPNVIENEDEDEGKRILTRDESDTLMLAAKGTSMHMPVILGLKMGLRFGECSGLEWKHVDFDQKVVRIRQQHQNVRGKGLTLRPPKTKAGRRDVPIPASQMAAMLAARDEAASKGIKWVCHRNGTPYSSQNGSVYFKEVALLAGFAEADGKTVPTHHDLRSTFLTYLANHADGGKGIKPHILMRIAGHSKLETTLKFYIRATDDDVHHAMSCIE